MRRPGGGAAKLVVVGSARLAPYRDSAIRSDARRGGDERIRFRVLIAHSADQLRHVLDASLVAPSLEIVNDGDQGRRIAETRITDSNRAGTSEHILNDILGVRHSP